MVIGIPTAIQIPSWWICALCINSPSLVYIPTLIRSFFYISTYDDDMCACSMRCKLSRTIPMWTFQFKLVQMAAVFTENVNTGIFCFHHHDMAIINNNDIPRILYYSFSKTANRLYVIVIFLQWCRGSQCQYIPCIIDWQSHVADLFPQTKPVIKISGFSESLNPPGFLSPRLLEGDQQ